LVFGKPINFGLKQDLLLLGLSQLSIGGSCSRSKTPYLHALKLRLFFHLLFLLLKPIKLGFREFPVTHGVTTSLTTGRTLAVTLQHKT